VDLNPVVIDAMSRSVCNSAKCNNLLSSVMEIELCKHFIKYDSPFLPGTVDDVCKIQSKKSIRTPVQLNSRGPKMKKG
jgi:hypothetical protein